MDDYFSTQTKSSNLSNDEFLKEFQTLVDTALIEHNLLPQSEESNFDSKQSNYSNPISNTTSGICEGSLFSNETEPFEIDDHSLNLDEIGKLLYGTNFGKWSDSRSFECNSVPTLFDSTISNGSLIGDKKFSNKNLFKIKRNKSKLNLLNYDLAEKEKYFDILVELLSDIIINTTKSRQEFTFISSFFNSKKYLKYKIIKETIITIAKSKLRRNIRNKSLKRKGRKSKILKRKEKYASQRELCFNYVNQPAEFNDCSLFRQQSSIVEIPNIEDPILFIDNVYNQLLEHNFDFNDNNNLPVQQYTNEIVHDQHQFIQNCEKMETNEEIEEEIGFMLKIDDIAKKSQEINTPHYKRETENDLNFSDLNTNIISESNWQNIKQCEKNPDIEKDFICENMSYNKKYKKNLHKNLSDSNLLDYANKLSIKSNNKSLIFNIEDKVKIQDSISESNDQTSISKHVNNIYVTFMKSIKSIIFTKNFMIVPLILILMSAKYKNFSLNSSISSSSRAIFANTMNSWYLSTPATEKASMAVTQSFKSLFTHYCR